MHKHLFYYFLFSCYKLNNHYYKYKEKLPYAIKLQLAFKIFKSLLLFIY